MTNSSKQPSQMRVSKQRDELILSFENGREMAFSAEMLRVLSPSAEVQGHSPSQRVTVGGKRNVKISDMSLVGNYAVRITFDDSHSTGIFSWDYFSQLDGERDQRWQAYLKELDEQGKNRDLDSPF